jgi:hypothetical protein
MYDETFEMFKFAYKRLAPLYSRLNLQKRVNL